MKIKLIILLSLLNNLLIAQWRVIAPTGTTINDITFTDKYNGYAVFQSSGIGNCSVTHGLLKTIDEGKNWVRMNTGNTSAIIAVHFVNQLTGWYAANSSEIRKTTDGGATWVQQSSGVGSGNNDIWFKDVSNGFVIGNNGALRKSTNGGATWQTIASGVTVALRKIFFANNNLGFIACGNGQILRTTDGGTTWSIITTGAGGINDIFFADVNNGYLSSGNDLFKTVDGGLTWSVVITGAINPIVRIFFTNASNGYLSVDGEGILKTTDAGLTWNLTPFLNGIYDTFYAIYFTDTNTGYIGGNLGKINKTTNGGDTWKNMTTGLGTELFTVFATNKDTAYTGGKDGKIFKTENGGITYFQQTRAFATSINKLYFLNNNIGFACSDSGRIMKTIDGGENWMLKPTNTSRGFTDFSFINPNQGFASAAGGLVFKTIDGGETWDSISTGITDAFSGIWFTNADTGYAISYNKIVRTFDAGATWNIHTSSIASDLCDIVFTNDSLGYCAGGFGKILFTTDAGLNWYPTNNNSNNAEINEMWFANDSVGYFAKQTSQSYTLDSCKVVGSLPTACLANNWTMNSICMTDGGAYGYCVGGLGGVIHQTEVREIYKTYTSTDTYCAGSNIFIAYYARGFYGAANIFTVQLSDASGSFASPVNIGTYTAVPYTYQSGIITATIPLGTPAGNNYRVRVIASDPAVIGVDNGYNIAIEPSFTPSINLTSSAQGAICAGSTITLSTTNFAGGLSPVYSWTINGNPISNNSSLLVSNTLQNGDIVQVSMVSNLACADVNPVLSNTYTATVVNGLSLSLANDTAVCQSETIQLTAPAGYNYNWTPSMGLNNPTIANPIAIITNSIEYKLTITDASGCVGMDSILISANQLPIFNLGTDLSACINATVQLSGPIGYSYNWTPTQGLDNSLISNPNAFITNDIEYVLSVTDTLGCLSTDSIFITANPLPQISFSTDTTICENVCITLLPIVSGGLQNVLWTPNSSLNDSTIFNPIACPSVNTIYTAIVTDTNQCTASSTIEVNVNAIPSVPQIVFDGDTLTTSFASNYQWYFNGNTINGANNIYYIPQANGDYTVEVFNSIGCGAISAPYTVNINAIANLSIGNDIAMLPNPVFDLLTIALSGNNELINQVIIYDAAGVKVYQQQVNSNRNVAIDVKAFSAGIYSVVLLTQKGTYTKKVFVIK